jgi:DNA-3-methyladenine glycosylase
LLLITQRNADRLSYKSRVHQRLSAAEFMRNPGFDITRARPLSRLFYDRDPRRVARELLGKLLVRKHGRRLLAGRIVEVEAYMGANDPAAHAAAGPTSRNLVLFGPPGYAYVYFIYGNHYCLNVSCESEGRAGCVLFRALEPVAGIEHMFLARGLPVPQGKLRASELRLLTSGPGRLAEALGITRPRDNAKDLTTFSDLTILDDGFRSGRVVTTPRVGINKAADAKLRYMVAGNEFVSGKTQYSGIRRQ